MVKLRVSLLFSTPLYLAFFVSCTFGDRNFTRAKPCCLYDSKGTSSAEYNTLGRGDATPSGSNFTYVCDPARVATTGVQTTNFGFCDKNLPYQVRAKDLVDRMTLDEKIQQTGDNAIGVPRLGLPAYEWWSEALHGVSNVGPGTFFDELVPSATSFPTVILSAASFNQTLWKAVGQAVSTEARAMFNLGRGGLTYWSPTINVVRDPRWGRITETPGEDPFVVGTYATNYVRGLQDVEGQENTTDLTSRPLKVSACCKHYTAYDVDNWNGTDRYHYDAEVTEQDMLETFLPPFEMCVKEGDSSSVMCSYNRVNGIPTCADPKLLNQTIRGEWSLRGYIVADCDSIEVMVDDHKFLGDTNEEAVARAFKAGLDLDCGDYYPKYGASAVKQGKVRVEDIDRSLIFLYILLMRVGFFDGNPKYSSLGKQDICSKQNMELAAEAARQGIVLLKNDNNTLPLNKATMSSLAVVGPHANATLAMIGNYAFDPKNPGTPCQFSSPINGFSKFGMVTAAPGCVDVACKNNSLFSQALDAAMNSDATIIVAGLDLSVEAESLDRNDLLLPGSQTDLITQVADASKGPVILVLMTAGGVDISSSINNAKIGGILWAGYPGQDGGRAIAEVVFGLHNPGGRLPITWYPADYVKQLPLTSMPLRPTGSYPGRTYKFYNGTTIFPFGYGLSYTKFNYKHIARTSAVTIKLNGTIKCRDIDYGNNAKPTCPALLINDLKCEETILFDVQVQNAGAINGDAVLLIYSKAPDGIAGAPLKQVVGFQRVFAAAGGNAMAKFELNACKSFGIVDYTGYRLLPSGINNIIIGDTGVTFPVEVIFQ